MSKVIQHSIDAAEVTAFAEANDSLRKILESGKSAHGRFANAARALFEYAAGEAMQPTANETEAMLTAFANIVAAEAEAYAFAKNEMVASYYDSWKKAIGRVASDYGLTVSFSKRPKKRTVKVELELADAGEPDGDDAGDPEQIPDPDAGAPSRVDSLFAKVESAWADFSADERREFLALVMRLAESTESAEPDAAEPEPEQDAA